MAKPRKGTCRVCGVTFVHELGGQMPKTCPEHRPKGNRARGARRAKERGDEDTARVLAKTPKPVLGAASRPVLMAIGLGQHSDPVLAAQSVGLSGSPEELAELAELARSDFTPFINLEGNALKRLGHGVIALLLQHTWDAAAAGDIPPNMLATTMKQVAAVLEALEQTGAKLIPTRTKVVWKR